MKRTQITNLLANIKATFVSFFSILMFMALGAAVFLDISWSAPALQNAAENVFNEGSFHHLQIQYPYGLTDSDLDKRSVTAASVEPVTGSFVKSVDTWAVGIGIFGSTALAVIMSLIALHRINRFKLTDINKT